jgi:hypothetical protein
MTNTFTKNQREHESLARRATEGDLERKPHEDDIALSLERKGLRDQGGGEIFSHAQEL